MSNYDGVKDVNNFVQVFDSLWFFEFGYNGDGMFFFVYNFVDMVDVRVVLDEGQSNKVDVSFESLVQVFFVFFGEGGNRYGNIGEVDVFVVVNWVSDSVVIIDVVVVYRVNLEDGFVVVDEDDVVGFVVLGQIFESGGDVFLIVYNVVSGDSEFVINFEVDFVV